MTIFVSGGTGFLGSWLVKKLSESGHDVHVLTRNPAAASHLQLPGVTLFAGDLSNVDAISRAMQGTDQVYHLAAYTGVWSKDPETYNRTNTLGTNNVLDAAVAHGVDKVVLTSSAGNYGPSLNGIITESSIRTIPFFNSYESSKSEADENALKTYGDKLHLVIVFPTRIFGPVMQGDPASVSLLISKLINENFRIVPGSGNSIGNYVDVHDVVNGLVLAMEKGGRSEKYIIGGNNCSYDEFYAEVLRIGNKEQKLIHMPVWVLRVFVQYEALKAKLGFEPLITPDWLAKVTHDWILSSEKAERELGYTITPLSESIERSVENLKK